MPHTVDDNVKLDHGFPTGSLAVRIRDQQIMPKQTKQTSAFYRNLEEALDMKRANNSLYTIVSNTWQTSNAVDFSSNDILSLGWNGTLRQEFLRELACYPEFSPGSWGSRLGDGNYSYIEQVEREIADFHHAEAGLMLNSGFEANVAVWSAVPQTGDTIVYDEYVHASTHEGIERSLTAIKEKFKHNDVESFRNVLSTILASQLLIRNGKRSVLIAVESFYSMDGDVCPLEQLVKVTEELFPLGNAHFIVDEAHSTGLVGENGAGLVCDLKLEKSIAIRVHTFGKAMAAQGAIVLGNNIIINTLVNFARSIIFTTAPSFPSIAAVRAGYNILKSGRACEAQSHVQDMVKLFLVTMTSHPLWAEAHQKELVGILENQWEEATYLTHIVPLYTSSRYLFWLFFHLARAGFSVLPVSYPVVAKGQSRMRIVFHAKNTESEVERLAETIFEWVEEMLSIQNSDMQSEAARQVYAWMAENNLDGFGRV